MKNARNKFWMGLLAALAVCAATARAATVTLDWDANTEPDLAGYRIYYAAGSLLAMTTTQAMGSASVTKRTSSGAGTSISINNLAEGSTYYFRLTAFDNSGEESDFGTAPLEISTCIPSTPPSAPGNLSVTPMTPIRIDLAWTYPGNSPTGFVVEWSVNGGASWTVIATLGGAARSYQSTVLTGVPYRYRVKTVKTGWADSGYATSGNVATSVNTTPSGVVTDGVVRGRLLSPGKADGTNDSLDFGGDAVEVRVFDTGGRTVFHGESKTGGIVWDGHDEKGGLLRTGVYIAKLSEQDGGIRYEKILIVK